MDIYSTTANVDHELRFEVTLCGRAAYELELNKSSPFRLDHEAEIGLAFRDNTAKGVIDRGFVER